MFEIHYWQMLLLITVLWIVYRVIANKKSGNFSIAEELRMLPVYICLIVIARIVYFPMQTVDGQTDTLRFDASETFPPKFNVVPIAHMFDTRENWRVNLIANIFLFIPVGMIWPSCFEKLDTVGKTILCGFCMSLFIELTQLLFYERYSDVDDLIMNTIGTAIGAIIYLGLKKISRRKRG